MATVAGGRVLSAGAVLGALQLGMSDSSGINIGSVVGGCQIIECIGSGGMGQVYKAQHKRLGRIIALKILPRDVIQRNPAGIERFFQEARALAQVDHPNVLTIHDCGQEGDYHFLQTRFIDGYNLEELIDQEPDGLKWDRVRDLMIGALEGLGAVHRSGIVHRDVKPANFMVDGGGKVVLMDFGLAKFLAADNEARTEPGYVLGTPQYMSPEQCDGLDLDNRSDLYSLGCVAYFLITGKRPFDGDNPLQIMKQHRDSFAEPLQARRPQTPVALCRVIERMMQKNPDDRYESAAACIAALKTVTDAKAPDPTAGAASLPPSYPPTAMQPRGLPATIGPVPGAAAPAQNYGAPVTLEAQSLASVYGGGGGGGGFVAPAAPAAPAAPPAQNNPYAGVSDYRAAAAAAPSPAVPAAPAQRPGAAAPLPPPRLVGASVPAPSPAVPPAAAAAGPVAPVVGAAPSGPTTTEINATIEKLRRNTGRLEKQAEPPAAKASAPAPAAAVVAAPAATAADVDAAARAELDRSSRVMQAVQCKHCHHIWRLERARVGKTVRCPNCNKDTLANIPENLLAPVNRQRTFLKVVIVVVLVGAFVGTVGYFYRLFEPADQKVKYVTERLSDITKLFEARDWPRIYRERFTSRLRGRMTEQEWEGRWTLKMNDRRVVGCTLDHGEQVSSPLPVKLSIEVQQLTGAGAKQTYTARLDLIEQDGGWMIDDFNME